MIAAAWMMARILWSFVIASGMFPPVQQVLPAELFVGPWRIVIQIEALGIIALRRPRDQGCVDNFLQNESLAKKQKLSGASDSAVWPIRCLSAGPNRS